MGIDVPDLDDRTFEELLEDARKRIPVHSEQWTDHNAHDPGITILELFAWIAESDIYRLDRVTDAHVERYLSLLGVRPRPPEPATGTVAVDSPASANGDDSDVSLAGVEIPARETLLAEQRSGESTRFEAAEFVALTDATLDQVLTVHPGQRTDNSAANETDGLSFLAFGDDPGEGSALYLGFDGDPFEDATRLDLRVEFHETDLPAPASHGEEPVEFEPSVDLVWEHCLDYDAWYDPDAWDRLTVLADETDALYRGGRVSLSKPEAWVATPGEVLDRRQRRHWIRCRMASSGSYEVPPQLDTVRTNVVPVEHRVHVEGETLTRVADGAETTDASRTETSGAPGQRFRFEHAPVLEATVAVGGEEWTEVESFDASGPDDAHYVLDSEGGELRFGDEHMGAIPAPGQRVVAEAYAYGGGDDGNVPQSASWRFVDDRFADLAVSPVSRPSGGRDAESVDAALDRLKRDLQIPHRAVTADDYRYVATHTPGLRFGRAAASVRERDVEGCEPQTDVRVVVVPYSPPYVARPEPSDGFLDAVTCHLRRHTLLTDTVTVVPPTYVGVGVTAEVGVASGYDADERAAAVEAAVDEFLHPLTGFDGDGWPFGRTVYRSELYEVLEGVEGVDCVFDLSLAARNEQAVDDGNVEIDEAALVYAMDHDVRVRPGRPGCGEDS